MNYQKIAIKKLIENKSFFLLTKLTTNNFIKTNKTIFKMIEAFYDKYNKLPDKDVLISYAKTNFKQEKAEIIEATLNSLNKIKENLEEKELISELKKETIVRQLDNVAENFVDALQEKNVNKILTITEQVQQNLVKIDNKLPEDITQVEYKKIGLTTIPCFLPTFQKEGIDLAGLTIVGAKSGQGKSVFALQQALYTYKQGYKVGMLSLELPASMLLTRLYSMDTNTPYNETLHKTDKETIEQWKKETFKPQRFFIKDVRYNIIEIKKAIQYLIKQGVSLIVIDYLNLLETNSSIEEWKQMANLVKDLHAISIENNIVILSPTQLNLSNDKKGNIDVTTRGSKELIFSSSLFLFIYQSKEEFKENVARIIVEKARSAKKLTLMAKTDFEHMKFIDLGITVN